MTYGWAILVVLVVIGALAYFGVLSPATLLPEKCTLPIQLNCDNHRVTATGGFGGGNDNIQIVLQNGAGRDIQMTSIAFSGDGISGACTATAAAGTTAPADNAQILPNGMKSTYITPATCNLVDTGRDKNRYDILVTYAWADSNTITHTFTGELLARAES